MGAIISRFRKEKTTYELLANLEEKISDLETYTITTQERQKRFVGNFLVISIVLYVLASLVFYFVFFPPTWNERIIHSLPLLICPMIITLVKKSLAWFFERKVFGNTEELKQLRAEKKKILEKVMDKETYKVAVDILNKFGDKSQRTQTQSLSAMTPIKGPQPMPMTPKGPGPIRPQVPHSAPAPQQMTPMGPGRQMAATPIGFNMRQQTPMMQQHMQQQQQQSGLIHRPVGMMPQQTMAYRRTPYPIINHNQKGVLEKMVDYLVGDGANSRFAMICKECLMHNGMALQEEYEYAAFRCAFCGAFNPSKKQRPLAPRLPFEQAQLDKMLREKRGSTSSAADSEPSSAAEDSNSAEADAASTPEGPSAPPEDLPQDEVAEEVEQDSQHQGGTQLEECMDDNEGAASEVTGSNAEGKAD